MTDEEQLRQVLHDFVDGGLVSKDIDKVLKHVAEQIIGIGIGEQGFVTSKDDIRAVLKSGIKPQDTANYSLVYNRIEIRIHGGEFANICADITIVREENGEVSKSGLLQTLICLKECGEWKICGLHASAPTLTVENVESYPLLYAENMLKELRNKIGEEAYLAEEQYRQAVLSDTIAFYIVSYTANCFEKCQLNGNMCVYAEPGTPYDEFVKNNLPTYVHPQYREDFLNVFSLDSIQQAIEEGKKELSYEYLFQCQDKSPIWMVTTVRLITDCATNEQKGIMYVKDIDCQKRREIEMQQRAERDVMTGVYNKNALIGQINSFLADGRSHGTAFLMIDIDFFKEINDTFGHPFGDWVLIEITGILNKCLGDKGIIGRLGGDEFGIFITEELSPSQVEIQAQDLLRAVQGIAVPQCDRGPVTCSVGVAFCEEADTFEEIYKHADEALYSAKREGRNRVSFYETRRR